MISNFQSFEKHINYIGTPCLFLDDDLQELKQHRIVDLVTCSCKKISFNLLLNQLHSVLLQLPEKVRQKVSKHHRNINHIRNHFIFVDYNLSLKNVDLEEKFEIYGNISFEIEGIEDLEMTVAEVFIYRKREERFIVYWKRIKINPLISLIISIVACISIAIKKNIEIIQVLRLVQAILEVKSMNDTNFSPFVNLWMDRGVPHEFAQLSEGLNVNTILLQILVDGYFIEIVIDIVGVI
jgi:hypothetical protein